MTPAERYQSDVVFATLVNMFLVEYRRCQHGGAGLTPTEVRDASAFAWQLYWEQNAMPMLVFPRKKEFSA